MRKFKKITLAMVAVFGLGAFASCNETPCTHTWEDGQCTKCESVCEHSFNDDNFCETCGEHDYELKAIPTKYRDANVPEKGTVVKETYTYNNEEKMVYVYLPYGYDQANTEVKYDVLYLLHGGGEAAGYWFKQGGAYMNMTNYTVTMLDNLIYYDMCKPVIVVTPTTNDIMNNGTTQNNAFREGLLPAIETKYNTYANGDVSDASLVATREHRGMAGFSMGGMTTYTIGMQQNLDAIAYFGCYTGSGDAQSLLNVMQANEQYPIRFFYNGQGTLDLEGTRTTQLKMVEDLLADGRYFVDGENFVLNDKPNKGHKYDCWIIDLYNTLTVCFFQ